MTGTLYIRPGAILTGGRRIEGAAALVEDGRIVAVGPESEIERPAGCEEIIDGDLLLSPGLIDLQINGAFGHDFTVEPESMWEVGGQLTRYGVTTFLPTVITSPPERVDTAMELLARGAPEGYRGAAPLGLHLEGPFLNPAKRGAHDPAYLRLPNEEAVARWSRDSGVLLATLAPELRGALGVVRLLRQRGVVMSAGHSMATAAEAKACFEAGAMYGTHLFNAMPSLGHREPGLAGALLAARDVTVGMIVDGIHVHPDVVALSWRAKGMEQFNLVTDAMAALGMPPGTYRLGERDVSVDGVSARLEDGTLAGSVLSLDQAVRNLVSFTGCEPAEAIFAATAVPARVLGLEKEYGSIAPGMRADMTLWTGDLRVVETLVGGKRLT
jgi:N-acetylglucosamine-6-phosphate deacetylase